jgi:hypothetical protein
VDSITVRAVRTQTHLVLKDKLIIDGIPPRPILGKLQADAGKLAGVVINHERIFVRMVVAE